MKKFKIKYQLMGNIRVAEVEASSRMDALYIIYMKCDPDDVLDISEVV